MTRLIRRLLAGTFEEQEMIPDPRAYDVPIAHGGFNAIADPGSSLYSRVIRSTPGLMQWWRLGTTYPTWSSGGGTTNTPYWPNSAGAATLWSPAGSPSVGAGLLSGDPDGGALLASGEWLESFDYFVQPSPHEIITIECWINFSTLGSDTALAGEWQSNVGWMIQEVGDDLRLWTGPNHIDAANVLVANTTHHIVGVVGGIQAPTPDFVSRLYVDEVEVANGDLTSGADLVTQASRFQINNYASGAASGLSVGTIDEVALYSRMLQPDEIKQHHQAGLGVLWP